MQVCLTAPSVCAQGIDVTGLPHVPAAPAPAPAAASASSAAAAQPVPYSQRKASPQAAPLGALAKMPAASAKPAAASQPTAPAAAPAGVNRWADFSLGHPSSSKRVSFSERQPNSRPGCSGSLVLARGAAASRLAALLA